MLAFIACKIFVSFWSLMFKEFFWISGGNPKTWLMAPWNTVPKHVIKIS